MHDTVTNVASLEMDVFSDIFEGLDQNPGPKPHNRRSVYVEADQLDKFKDDKTLNYA